VIKEKIVLEIVDLVKWVAAADVASDADESLSQLLTSRGACQPTQNRLFESVLFAVRVVAPVRLRVRN